MIENISIDKGKFLATKGVSKHITEYDIVSDTTSENGTRTILIKPTDKTEILKLCAELADKMVEKMGEGDNKLLRTMLLDTLKDYEDKNIQDMHKRVVLGKAPVKYREG